MSTRSALTVIGYAVGSYYGGEWGGRVGAALGANLGPCVDPTALDPLSPPALDLAHRVDERQPEGEPGATS